MGQEVLTKIVNQDGFVVQLISTVAKRFVKTTGQSIAAASLSSGDVIGLDITRVALDGGNNPTDEPIMFRIEIEYVADNLGEPVT